MLWLVLILAVVIVWLLFDEEIGKWVLNILYWGA